MRFVAFSDIHYADYSTGVTVDDVVRVERAVTDDCVEFGASFCVFGGDRYLAHEPPDYVRVVSDLEQKHRNDAGIVTFSLVGNHDLYAKAPVSGHSNRHLQAVWHESLPNVVVMDTVKTYRHARVPGVAVHAVPACFQWEVDMLQAFDFQDGEYNLLVFHDMLEGSLIDHRSNYTAEKGKKLSLIDDARFDLVLGGDVHIPQRLPFQSTQGGYIGAAIQQSRRDRGNSRGWLQIDTDAGTMQQVESPCPRFLEVRFDLTENMFFSAADVRRRLDSEYEDFPEGNIIDVVVSGMREDLDSMPVNWSDVMCGELRARRVNVMKRLKSRTPMAASVVSRSAKTPVEDLECYLKSGRAPVDGYDVDRLLEKASPILALLDRDGGQE